MFQRILVPVDGSSTSQLALQAAVKLAKERRAKLRVVSVVDEINFNLENEHVMNQFIEAVRKTGLDILAKSAAAVNAAGIQAETQLLEIETFGHHIADVIVDEAKRWPADLIVIGTHGRRGVSHLLLGSVAEKVVHIATVPVLLIRGQQQAQPERR